MNVDPEYLQYCLSKLTDNEFTVYCAVKALGECHTTQEAIGEIISKSAHQVCLYIQKLEKKGFIIYEGKSGKGITILWIRHSSTEKQPDPSQMKYRFCGYKLISPEGKTKVVMPGKIREFCREQKLNRKCFYLLVQGERNHHKGWKLA